MKKFFKDSWEVSAHTIASIIPLVCLPLLPFHPLHNFLLGLFLSFTIICFLFRVAIRKDRGFQAAAQTLGVSSDDLRIAVREAGGFDAADMSVVAQKLGVSEEAMLRVERAVRS